MERMELGLSNALFCDSWKAIVVEKISFEMFWKIAFFGKNEIFVDIFMKNCDFAKKWFFCENLK